MATFEFSCPRSDLYAVDIDRDATPPPPPCGVTLANSFSPWVQLPVCRPLPATNPEPLEAIQLKHSIQYMTV